MNQLGSSSFLQDGACVAVDKYSRDSHLLSEVFKVCLSRVYGDYGALYVITDINRIEKTAEKIRGAYIILCDLDRYSDKDLARFVAKSNAFDLLLFNITAENARTLLNHGLENTDRSLLLLLEIPQRQILCRGSIRQSLSVDLHSSQLVIDPALLLPHHAVPSVRPQLENSEVWLGAREQRSLLQSFRYPLGVTKRHVKNCLRDLRGCFQYLPPVPACPTIRGRDAVGERSFQLELNGTVFLAIFEKLDFASDWSQLVTAFCLTLKDHRDATLLLWVSSEVSHENRGNLHHILCSVAPFSSSVALIEGELDPEDLHTLFSTVHFLINVEMYRSARFDLVLAGAYGLPVISVANSVFGLLNEELIWRALAVDERLAAPDQSECYHYSRRHRKALWEDLSEKILQAYQLYESADAYQNVREHQSKRYERLVGQYLTDLSS